jgi:hypothetical protein
MARKAGAEKMVERSGSAVARVESCLEGRLLDFSGSGCGSDSLVRGRPAKASGAESLEKRVSKELKKDWKVSLLDAVVDFPAGGEVARRLGGMECGVPWATILPPTCWVVTSGVIGRARLWFDGLPRAVARLLAMDEVRSRRGGRRIDAAARLGLDGLETSSLDLDLSLGRVSSLRFSMTGVFSSSLAGEDGLMVVEARAFASCRWCSSSRMSILRASVSFVL